MMRLSRHAISLVMTFIVTCLPCAFAADAAPNVAQTFNVRVIPGKFSNYLEGIKKARAIFARVGIRGDLRVWNTAIGGPDAGTTLGIVEYPDMATWAADTSKLAADPEWQQILATATETRTILDSSLWREITPATVDAKPGSVLVVMAVAVNPGKLEEYRKQVANLMSVATRLGMKNRMSMWQSTAAGANTGMVVVGVEYPDMSAYVADDQKLQADAEWQKILASIDQLRTLKGRWIYTEIAR